MGDGTHQEPLGRRAALAAAGAGALVLPLALAACGGKESEEGVTANEDLMREHGVLRRILVLYREVGPLVAAGTPFDVAALARATAIFRTFGERYHEDMLEEQHIFPAVRKAGGDAAGLVDVLIAQHRRGREITGYVIDQTRGGRIASGQAAPLAAALAGFARMYEAHAAREDTIVFPAFKKALSEHQYEELGERFEEIERQQFGGDGFDIANADVSRIEQALGLADLARFTPPPPVPAARG